MIFFGQKIFVCKTDFFGQIFSVQGLKKKLVLRNCVGRSTASTCMVTDFALGITFSHKILVKLWRQISFANVNEEKIHNPSFSRRSP